MPCRVGKAEFARLVEAALAEVPPAAAAFLEEVPVEIHDRPTVRQLKSVGLSPRDLLLGLYVGTSLADRSVEQGLRLPSVIFVFQDDLECVSDTRAELMSEVRKTVLHEIGHHFGLDEGQLDDLGYG